MLCKPKSYYDEQRKVAIGYKNPLYLTRAKQVQPALYNSHEIIKTNHAPTVVHDSEDTLKIAETTRKQMTEKMKDPECVKKKVKIAPHDYSKENYLSTSTPQKQLTPEQIFWSNDLLKMKAEALKEQTTVSRPIKALTVYSLNTPATLVPRVLPTKSQVKINIFALIQLFSEFEKTCKKRITPTGLTEGERGFEQTKECYLTKVILFFKTLKEHFVGIQKALTKEIKEMKEIFKELEAEVDQNVVDRKYDEIERKNLLIANDNLIADCLSKEVFYIATNYELIVARFTEIHDAHTIVQVRCLELEAELYKLKDKIQKDDHNELVKRFSNLEVVRNITPDSTNMSHRGGEIDQDAEHDQVKSPLLKAEFFKTKDIVEKEVYNELSNIFLQLEKHCISLEISIQQKEESFQSNKPCRIFKLAGLRWIPTGKMFTDNTTKVDSEPPNGSNDMAHNHYLEEARKKTQERNRNSKPSVMHTTSLQNTTNGSKPNPRSNNQISRSLPVSKSSCGMSNDCYMTKVFSQQVFCYAGLRWIPTGKMFIDSTTKVDSKPPNGSNEDITNPYECDQTLNVSACTLNISVGTSFNPNKERLRVWLLKRLISHKPGLQGIQI
ncbi:hypothetical protein Tco_0066975 [Tanacetum coccineum]